ncbi:sensor domain-containing protein [Streptomyces iconiensis]|uniref:Sensor domain-containing protein n=1 Tax=Streptomyces iconiensis TaxID=1384038 RepID=A0ABT7A830_9ACTN|nr:sensor domain-containing protein [Streptomyces iconiensis]MDJ1137491.1 sensor domain-containing protein [Streptomyces iconiensis]
MTTATAAMDTKVTGPVTQNPHPETYDAYGAHGSGVSVRRGTRFGRQVAYLLSGLPIGIAAFTLVLTGFCAGAPTLILLLGLPVLAGTLAVARYFARIEAAQIALATGRPLPPEAERPQRGGWGLLADAQGWRDLVHAIVAFPVRVVTFALTLVWTVGALGGLTYGLWAWTLPHGENDGWMELAFGWTGTGADIMGNAVVGLFFLLTVVPLVRGLTLTQAGLGRVMLRGGTL